MKDATWQVYDDEIWELLIEFFSGPLPFSSRSNHRSQKDEMINLFPLTSPSFALFPIDSVRFEKKKLISFFLISIVYNAKKWVNGKYFRSR